MQGREFKDAVFEQFARVARALASPNRLEIVDLLTQGPRSVESIAQQTSITVNSTSRNLQVLRNAGLAPTRHAQRVVYRVADLSVVGAYRALREAAKARIAEVRRLAEAFFGEVDGVEPLGVEQFLERSGQGDVVVVDVRPAEEFAAGHIAGAVSMPLGDLTDRIADLPPMRRWSPTAGARTACCPPRPSAGCVRRGSRHGVLRPASKTGVAPAGRSRSVLPEPSHRVHPSHPQRL